MSQMSAASDAIAPDFGGGLAFASLRLRLDQVLQRRDVDLSAQEFLEIVAEASAPAEPLTAGEREFLLANADVTVDDLSDNALRRAAATVQVSEVAADARARASAVTTADAAALTGIAPSNLRRMIGQGRLCTVGTRTSGAHLLPRWQFADDGRVLPGIAAVTQALPTDYHPLDVAAFMETPVGQLRDRSPAQWLAAGGAVDAVVALADERARE